MNKQAFLTQLRTRLQGIPQEDLEERLSFYSEMIDDRVEEGLTEEEAVAEIGSLDEIVSQILADYPLSKIVKEKMKSKRRLTALEIVLLVLGFPLWFPLLIAAFAVLLSLYITVWAVDISLWAVDLAFAACALCGFVFTVIFAVSGVGGAAVAALGLGVFSVGLTILMFYGCLMTTKGILLLTKKMFLGIKAMFVGKEHTK